jgi:NTP pyrophosphatase (non-canonical NTP hydrolase)
MEFNEYQMKAMRTAPHYDSIEDQLDNGIYGLIGEVGELIDHIKKHKYQGHPLDKLYITKELGDINWYLALIADAIGIPYNSVAESNILKLLKRYPDGFKVDDSINRCDKNE